MKWRGQSPIWYSPQDLNMFHNNRETLIKSVIFNPRMPLSGSIFEISPFFYPQFNLFHSPMKGDTEKVHFTAEPELHHIIIANVYLCHPLDNWIYRWAGSLCSLWHLTVTTCVMWPCDAMECSLSSFPLLSSPPQCWVILVRVCVCVGEATGRMLCWNMITSQ